MHERLHRVGRHRRDEAAGRPQQLGELERDGGLVRRQHGAGAVVRATALVAVGRREVDELLAEHRLAQHVGDRTLGHALAVVDLQVDADRARDAADVVDRSVRHAEVVDLRAWEQTHRRVHVGVQVIGPVDAVDGDDVAHGPREEQEADEHERRQVGLRSPAHGHPAGLRASWEQGTAHM